MEESMLKFMCARFKCRPEKVVPDNDFNADQEYTLQKVQKTKMLKYLIRVDMNALFFPWFTYIIIKKICPLKMSYIL